MFKINCYGKFSILIITLGFLVAAGTPKQAFAQSTSSGCTALSGGVLNQTVPANGIGSIMSAPLTFIVGDKIVVTITDATNSLFEVGSNTIFSGETGSQSKSFTVIVGGSTSVFADIQGLPGSTASISATCASGTSGGGGTTTNAAADTAAAVDAAFDAFDVARPSTKPGDLPSRFSSSEQKLPQGVKRLLAQLETAENGYSEALDRFETQIENTYGIDPDDLGFVLLVSSFISAGQEVTTKDEFDVLS